uniref:Putative 26S proteasome regulatory subunit rpn3 n=1 Tax=Talaromyces marneffei PM1 TaxID=1077442 RepID=A0A093VA55_TALMA
MPVERRSLRSNSKGDTSSSTNGEKSRANSNTASSKDKAAPTTRSAANKAKSAPAKKAVTGKGASSSNTANNNTMSGDQPQRNGTDPVENGVNGSEDVEMEEDTADIQNNFGLLERAVTHFDARFTLRVLRSISSMRKHITPDVLAEVIVDTYSSSNQTAVFLLEAIGKSDAFEVASSKMEVDSDKPKAAREILPEVDTYLSILVQIYLYDQKEVQRGADFSSKLVERLRLLNRRTLDSLTARVYFYFSLFYEQLAPLPPSPAAAVISIRKPLLAALRTAVLRKDVDIQATVITLLLRNYLSTSHITQADLLIAHNEFPAAASNNQIARYLYYLGRIRAIQLRYSEAHEHLTGATRKSPTSHSAGGFYQASMKLLVIVDLLMGDIPDRSVFRQPSLEKALHPYFLLVRAVSTGDLDGFLNIVNTHGATFRKDGTYTLILRLRQNVIKTGIRVMSIAYSRISLRDICLRLGLHSEESAEYIVAKAIRDGVIDATLDHEQGYMKSKDAGDIYLTTEPGEAFHARIQACLSLHDESVKAMRFPMNQHRLELKNAQEARERERELVKEIQDGDMDEDDAGGDFDGI